MGSSFTCMPVAFTLVCSVPSFTYPSMDALVTSGKSRFPKVSHSSSIPNGSMLVSVLVENFCISVASLISFIQRTDNLLTIDATLEIYRTVSTMIQYLNNASWTYHTFIYLRAKRPMHHDAILI
jgi:hypothetical protein